MSGPVKVLVGILLAVGLFGVFVLLGKLLESGSFRQPRDALLEYSFGYEKVFTDADFYGDANSPQGFVDEFLEARNQVLALEWWLVVEALADKSKWLPIEMADPNLSEWAVRDDFYRMVDEIGGFEALKGCSPVVKWEFAGPSLTHEFRGVDCGAVQHRLKY